MKYIWKLYKWNNGDIAERTDLTQYLIEPIFLERRLNERLSSGEIVLDGVPTDTMLTPLSPKTKLTIERRFGDIVDYYDYVVDHDDVEQYRGCPEYCCHRIHLIEPSVIAQGMHCDNFSLTYELNDVTLEYKTVVPSGAPVVKATREIPNNYRFERPVGAVQIDANGWHYRRDYVGMLYYENSYYYQWSNTTDIDNLLQKLNGLEEQDIDFDIPTLKCYAHTEDGDIELFECPVRCRITRRTLIDGVEQSGSALTVVDHFYNPGITVQNRNDRYMYKSGGKAGLRNYPNDNYSANIGSEPHATVILFQQSKLSNFPALINTSGAPTQKNVSFTTTKLTPEDQNNKLSYRYDVQFNIEPYESGSIVSGYRRQCVKTVHDGTWWNPFDPATFAYKITAVSTSYKTSGDCQITLSFYAADQTTTIPTPFLLKGVPYNAYDLFRKAMLTCDTRVIDNSVTGLDEQADGNGIKYPIEVEENWANKLKQTKIYESVFENKNLWEVITQIGYYLHAVPFLEFARDGEEKFILRFRQLGKGYDYDENGTAIIKPDSNRITIFNSQALDEFYTQYDSYVTNIFSPQNEVEEFLVCKTSSDTTLVSNNTAELHTKYNILEIVEFDIIRNGITKSALEYIFEESIYKTLTSKTSFTPGKWSALYYRLGDNKIQGLNYVPPTVNNDGFMALKTIVAKLFTNGTPDDNLHFNDLQFRIKYRTQDSLRITQLRPDISKFLKNSEFDQYPHHEQFYGQQDKILDSERFSANLWGRLVRVANGVYQCQEYSDIGSEKIPGDIVNISGEAYYVMETENEYYREAILQKVTYSKDFNNLSNIVTIPSEPRFYEVSERSMIRREVRLLEFLRLGITADEGNPRYLNALTAGNFLAKLLFADGGNPTIPNYAYTVFRADVKRQHEGVDNNDNELLFPSSETQIVEGAVQPLPNSANKAVIVPALHFPLRNSLIIEWDMDDNFKAGDCVDAGTSGIGYVAENQNVEDTAYYALQAIRYCDLYGRADLMDFRLFHPSTEFDIDIKRRLPLAVITPTAEESLILTPSGYSIALDKDNREALSFNYQLNLLYDNEFVTFPNLFGKKQGRLHLMLLNITVSKLSETLDIPQTSVVEGAGDLNYGINSEGATLIIDIPTPPDVDLSKVKALLFYDIESGSKIPYLTRNVEHLANERKLDAWCIGSTLNEDAPAQTFQPFTVNIGVNGQGSVTPSGQITVSAGSAITLTATPAPGATFRWFSVMQAGEVLRLYPQNPLTLLIDKDTTITAIFQGGIEV